MLQASGETQHLSTQPDCKRTCRGVCSECRVITAHTEPGQLPNPPRAGAGTFIPGKRLLQRLCPRFNDVSEVSWTSCCSVMRKGIRCLLQLVSWKARSGGSWLVMDNIKLGFFPPFSTTQSCPSPHCCLPISWLTGGRKAPWQLAAPNPPALIYYHQNQLQMSAGPGLCCQLGRLMQRFLLCLPGTEGSRDEGSGAAP